ncbi:AAA family ATPase [Dyella nitratireducens]|uniref:AAA+ ATPase domain-containing protein n=1 Tax=Dyella nitratireducens TaxID=1849580 RepID=A0ABQ1GC68_9GAMM|nr:AAA family ATPase [Dyella nitratireducens]GGA40785.1 hypothetical protein GCM10010981_32500 [Dyella nitratireducens]GLQ40608.1 hypothetical protein GCM10007902_04570 [Dyella nitratireducens]
MNAAVAPNDLFDQRVEFPHILAKQRYQQLVGLDQHKDRLSKILTMLVHPAALNAWFETYHPGAQELRTTILRRPPLVILAGDVGSGKTELAETTGDAIARQHGKAITLLPLSLSSRGQGRVGEMTQLITTAFDQAIEEARRYRSAKGASGGVIFLVDEADALAQSREIAQMHHEDRAGVNAFIRGVDRIANAQLPIAVIMCTNRLSALDPAVRRRAADILAFERPNDAQREHVLTDRLGNLGFSSTDVKRLVQVTGHDRPEQIGFTFSDLTQRLIPAIVLDAFPHRQVTATRALEIARTMAPTPRFQDGSVPGAAS